MRPAGRLFFSAEGTIKAIHRFDADLPDDAPEVFITQATGDPTSDEVEDDDTDLYADVVYPFEEEDRHAATVLITAILSEVYHSVMQMSPETVSAMVELHIAAYQLMGLDMLNQVFYEVMHPSDEGDSNGNTQESSSEESSSEAGGKSPGEESGNKARSEESGSEAGGSPSPNGGKSPGGSSGGSSSSSSSSSGEEEAGSKA